MTSLQLHYIVSLEKYKNFVKAAENCNVTQPALTMQVKNLEEELGVVLFDRSKKPLATTPIGAKVVAQAVETIRQMDVIFDLVEEHKNEFKGTLRVGIIPTISPYLVPFFISSFTEKYPEIKLEIIEDITENIVTGLKLGEFDAGILVTPLAVNGIRFQPLFYEKFYVYASENHPLYASEAVDRKLMNVDDLWLLNEGNCFRNQVINICGISGTANQTGNFNYESFSIESLKCIVDNQKGYTLIPELATLNVPASNEDMLKEFSDINPVREISLAYNKVVLKERFIKRLQDEIITNVPKHMHSSPDGVVIDIGLKMD